MTRLSLMRRLCPPRMHLLRRPLLWSLLLSLFRLLCSLLQWSTRYLRAISSTLKRPFLRYPLSAFRLMSLPRFFLPLTRQNVLFPLFLSLHLLRLPRLPLLPLSLPHLIR
ncbi:Uncharacterised protein [Mycobacterium tuberculosis]|nr:Uncharacterised protein [Mycobacterium tuberculosis]